MSDRRNAVIPCDAEGEAELFMSSAAPVQGSENKLVFKVLAANK